MEIRSIKKQPRRCRNKPRLFSARTVSALNESLCTASDDGHMRLIELACTCVQLLYLKLHAGTATVQGWLPLNLGCMQFQLGYSNKYSIPTITRISISKLTTNNSRF